MLGLGGGGLVSLDLVIGGVLVWFWCYKLPTTSSSPCTLAPTHAPTHAGPSLLVSQDPKISYHDRHPVELYDTAAISYKIYKKIFTYKHLLESLVSDLWLKLVIHSAVRKPPSAAIA